MADMILRAERVVRHSRRFYLRLCAFCDRAVGLASAPGARGDCEHGDDLLAQARRRVETLGRPAPEPEPPAPPRPRGGRGRRARLASTAVAAARYATRPATAGARRVPAASGF
ncbi:MAG: hypothetical protein KF878_14705 [Planctomycetes bacterium]|nr:hypothetical protein [Planctomycetota bacterium]